MSDISELTGPELSILGVTDLVESSTNKLGGIGAGGNEGVTGEEIDVLKLSMDDEELLKLAHQRETQYSIYEAKIQPRQQENKRYYLGIQGGGMVSKNMAANLLFEAEETFLAAALAKNPEPVVYSDNTDAGNQLSSDIKTMLQYHATTLKVRKKLQMMVRQWSIYHLGVLKFGWDKEIKEIKLETRKIQNFIFDPHRGVDAYGDFPSWLGERITVTAEELVKRFPDKKSYIRNEVQGRMGTPVTYTEWWEDDKTYCTFSETILDKSKNPHFNYETEEEGEFNLPVTKDGVNHFAKPKKPYVFLSVFSLEEQPHDLTGLIEQNIPQQNLITEQIYQGNKNIRLSNNSTAFSEDNFNQQTGKQAATAMENGDPILVPPGRPISEAIVKFAIQALPPSFFQFMENNMNNLRSIFGTQGITAQPPNEDSTARGMILSQQYDNSRIGGGIGDSVEGVAENIFNYFVQLYYKYYDEPHFASVMGQLAATEYIVLSNDKFSNGGVPLHMVISVSPDSMKPKDELTIMNQAMELWAQKAIDLKNLLTILQFPDPQETAAQAWLYNTNPQLYGQMNFPELQKEIQQLMAQQPPQGQSQPPQGGQPPQPIPPQAPPTTGEAPANAQLSQVPLPS